MASATGDRFARRFARLGFLGLARCLALVWLVPALLFNVDWKGHGTWQANGAAIILILASALFIEGAVRFRSLTLTPLCIVSALILVFVNTKAATRNLSLASEAASEAKGSEITTASHLASQRSQLEKRIAAQVQLVGWTAVDALQSGVDVAIASDASQWRVSRQCEAPNGPITGAYCTRVAEAKAKVGAAQLRDQLQAQLDKVPVPAIAVSATGQTDAVADSYVANVKALAGEMGFKPSDRIIKAEEALSRAFAFELVAALGPSCWLAFVDLLFGAGAHVSGRRKEAKSAASKAPATDTKAAEAEPTASADDIDRWIADDLEECPTGSMTSKELRIMCHAWCSRAGVPKPAERDLWPRMKSRFKHDGRNNRPRYLGIKPRVKLGPRLAVNNDPA